MCSHFKFRALYVICKITLTIMVLQFIHAERVSVIVVDNFLNFLILCFKSKECSNS